MANTEDPRWTRIQRSYDRDATEILVDDPSLFDLPSAIGRAPMTGEIVRILDASGPLKVERGFGGTSAAPLHKDEDLILIGWDESHA